MTVTAQLHDGTELQFPDGTDPAIIQGVVKRHLSGADHPMYEAPQESIASQAESKPNIAKNVLLGFAAKGNQAMNALNPFSSKESNDRIAAEQEWVKQNAGAGAGSMAADIVHQIPMALAAPEMAASKLGAAALGGLYGFATTPGSYADRAHEGVMGGAGGALGATVGEAVPYVAKALHSMSQPFYESGRKQIVADFMKKVIGENTQGTAGVKGVLDALDNAKPLIPGSQPTAAEVANNGGLSAMQRWAQQANPSEYAFRNTQNANAREAAINSIGKTGAYIDAAKLARSRLAEPFYDSAKSQSVAIDNDLLALLHRPSMGAALDKASKIAAENGTPISADMKALIMDGKVQGFIDGGALHHLKIGLDSMLHDPKNPIAGEEQRALKNTIKSFESWREANIPDYAKAQKIYAGMSRPINQMQIGQALHDAAKPALTDFGDNLTRETGNKFALAIRDGERTVKKATGKDYLSYDNIMTPRQKALISAVGEDFNRKIGADELGRGIGSNTFQNLAMQNMSEKAGMIPSVAMKTLSRVPIVGGIMSGGEQAIMKGPEERMKVILSEALLDPKKTAELLRKAKNISGITDTLINNRAKSLPGVLGSSLLLNKDN
jgi:hypothetical protein